MAQGQKSAATIRREAMGQQPAKHAGYAAAARKSHAARFGPEWEARKAEQDRQDAINLRQINRVTVAAGKAQVVLDAAGEGLKVQQAAAVLRDAALDAVRFLHQCVKGEIDGATATNRVEAAKVVLGSAPVRLLGANSQTASDKEAGQMSRAELEAFISAGRLQLAALDGQLVEGEIVQADS
jgi:hypothetical protein